MPPLRVMCVRKSADDNYKMSAQRSIHSILNALKKKMEVKEVWVVHSGGSISRRYDDNIDVYNAFSFSDGAEIIRTLSPNVVIISNDFEYLQRSLLKAAARHRIPTVSLVTSAFGIMNLNEDIIEERVGANLRLLTDHPRSIIRRYLFLLKTLFRERYSLGYILKTIVKDIYLPFISQSSRYNFGGGDLNLVSTPYWLDFLTKKGIDRNKIIVTGDISMDVIHQKLGDIERLPTRDSQGKLEILFVTSPMVEHGLWTHGMRKRVVTGVVKAIREQFRNGANIRVKIHPVTESLEVYEQLIFPVDRNVEIVQNADLLYLIKNSDLIVCFGKSSAMLEAVLLRKPVFIMNMLGEDSTNNYYLRENIAMECKSTEELIRLITDRTFQVIDSNRLDAFLTKYVYLFDGKCSERAANQIISLLCGKNNNN